MGRQAPSRVRIPPSPLRRPLPPEEGLEQRQRLLRALEKEQVSAAGDDLELRARDAVAQDVAAGRRDDLVVVAGEALQRVAVDAAGEGEGRERAHALGPVV